LGTVQSILERPEGAVAHCHFVRLGGVCFGAEADVVVVLEAVESVLELHMFVFLVEGVEGDVALGAIFDLPVSSGYETELECQSVVGENGALAHVGWLLDGNLGLLHNLVALRVTHNQHHNA